jgi:DNA-binding transcriptional regulator LsrR (DeoR family)
MMVSLFEADLQEGPDMARIDELRLMVRVARLYYEQELGQPEIAAQLDLSQSSVSRLLNRARQEQIVRTTVSAPIGTYAELEEGLEQIYGLKEAIVVDSVSGDDDRVLRDIGAAAAFYLETTLKQGEVIGISSWSATILAMVDAMQPVSRISNVQVVQTLGGVGNPSANVFASSLISRLASLVHGEATVLPAPGVVGSVQVRQVLLEDPYVFSAMQMFDKVTLALVGIGTVEPSGLLASSGNIFSPQELDMLRQVGAAGDICLRFFDHAGNPVSTPLNDRVIGMELQQLQRVSRAVGVAGGKRKLNAIRGALEGRWINVLITDRYTAEHLIQNRNELAPNSLLDAG